MIHAISQRDPVGRHGARGAPMVTTIDGVHEPIVWMLGAEGDTRLQGYRGDTGRAVDNNILAFDY